MLVNSSAFSNQSSIDSSLLFGLDCLILQPDALIFSTFAITTLPLLSLCAAIFHHGLQQWRQRSFSTAAHSDTFTYNVVTMEIISIFGGILCCYGIYKSDVQMLLLWFYLYSFTWYGETCFHLLTCVEHYLAVVHPITYLNLRNARWIRNRHILIVCIWLFCLACTGLLYMGLSIEFFLLGSSLVISAFCSLSVLCVLIHPSPGEHSGDWERVDQSKKRAFYIITAMLGVLVLRCVWNIIWDILYALNGNTNECSWIICGIWLNFPGSLVLPLIFLHRVGILACFKNNIR